jgi:hypothetical protein
VKLRTIAAMFLKFIPPNSDEKHISRPLKTRSLDAKIDRAVLRERNKSYLSGHYLSLHITVVSVVLAAAGAAAASLIARPVGTHYELFVLWPLWTGSLVAAAVAYGGPMVGAFALPSTIPTISDLLFPLLIGITEFLLFAILVNQVTPVGLDFLVNAWLIIVAVFAFVAGLSVLRARHHYATGINENIYSKDVSTMIERYLRSLDRDSVAAGATAALAAAGAGLRLSDAAKLPAFIFPLIITVLLLLGLRGHSETARMWHDLLPNKLAALHRSPVPAYRRVPQRIPVHRDSRARRRGYSPRWAKAELRSCEAVRPEPAGLYLQRQIRDTYDRGQRR